MQNTKKQNIQRMADALPSHREAFWDHQAPFFLGHEHLGCADEDMSTGWIGGFFIFFFFDWDLINRRIHGLLIRLRTLPRPCVLFGVF